MQEIKVVVLQVGVPHKGLGVVSTEEASEYLAYQYTSKGYELADTHYLGEVKNPEGGVQGYNVMFVLTNTPSKITTDGEVVSKSTGKAK